MEGLKGSSREKTVKMAEQKMEENSGDYFADIQYMTYIQWLHDIHAMVTWLTMVVVMDWALFYYVEKLRMILVLWNNI